MKSGSYSLESFWNNILDLLFPESCLGCQTRNAILCDRCIANASRALRETNDDIQALFDYRDPLIKKAIWNLKYYHRRNLGNILGVLLYESFLEDMAELQMYDGKATILVIPVPLSHHRKKERGYNQAEIIARHFVQASGKDVCRLETGLVIKKFETKPQARINSRSKRLQNLHGAFAVTRPEIVKGKTVIVIDDVTTTGATLNEIIKILKKAGAKKVVGLAIAH